ncbi:protein of unknown function [Legionella fallonii LLAP-10]|uniref:Uncharacterized protein n=1 Tax=Legionella fallonii LLAP-10 TaxID=1212491 RepID=A0A098G900_9GAMM|nr:protein of unknown function [Legionella fallonii LLAP-10]
MQQRHPTFLTLFLNAIMLQLRFAYLIAIYQRFTNLFALTYEEIKYAFL